jgi:hypothetical protein
METVSTPKMEQMDTKSQKKRRANSPLVPLFESLDKNLADPNSTLRQMVEVLDSKFIDLEILVEVQTGTIDKLTEENSQLQRRCNVNEGRITRLEKVVEDLREEALNSTAHSTKDNFIFQNIAEHPEEVNVKQTLVDFMAKELLIQATDLQSISINKVHRMGAKGKHGRAIIANIDDNGKSIIWKHARNLKGKNFNVFTQMPRELAERKRQLLPHYKAAKEQKKKVRWMGDKLFINDNMSQVNRDSVKNINADTTDVAMQMRVKRAPPKTYGGSTFQGSKVDVSDPENVIPALHAIYTDVRSARATHNIYAYRIKVGQHVIEHFEDDGEYGAGRRLLALLQQMDICEQLVCVSRWYGGKHLGLARFDHITEAGKLVLGR